MRVIGYVRVSTSGQAEDGLGLDVQKRAIRKWAKQNDHRLIKIVSDEVSGRKGEGDNGTLDLEARPGLADALLAIEENRAGAVVVHRLDRLARTLTLQEAILGHVWKRKGRVFSVADEGEILEDDPDDPMRTAMRQMRGVFSQLERGMIVVRMKAGRERRGDEGKYAYGAPPYGWRAARTPAERRAHKLMPEPEEQAVIALMSYLHKERKLPLAKIAKYLNDEGIPARRGRWHPPTVRFAMARAKTPFPSQSQPRRS